ncbi:MAG: type II secretion system F family protein [Phycisphaeraceae bacterium]|nr:type II secretion system F family protein [Phycisphaeraceae bacterium]
MKLVYQAYNRLGEAVSGEIEAASAHEATEALYATGVYVTGITSAATADMPKAQFRFSLGGNRLKTVASATRQLAVLTSTGTSVVQALAAVERQLDRCQFRTVIADVLRRVEEGEPLSDAMSHHPAYFDAVYRSLIAAGEASGQLSVMLDRLAQMTRKTLKIRNTVTGALAYPIMLMTMSVAVVITMLVGVLPRFAGLFQTLGAKVPASTQMLLDVSDSLTGYWWAYLIAAGLAGGTLAWFIRSERGPRTCEALAMKSPVVGPFLRSMATARLVRTLGVLSEAKVPLLDAIVLTRDAAGSDPYRRLMDKAEQAVIHGKPISSVMRENPLISPAVYEAFVTGERSGQVGPILVNLSEFLDEDNEVVVKSTMSLIEPAILVVLGGIVGFVALSIFLPLFDLTAAAGSGGG